MNLKRFLIFSFIIHAVGAIALYFYYNPVTFAPKPVKAVEEESTRQPEQVVFSEKDRKKKRLSNLKERSLEKKTPSKKKVLKESIKEENLQKENIPFAKTPETKTVKSSVKTEDSPVGLDLQAIKENPLAKQTNPAVQTEQTESSSVQSENISIAKAPEEGLAKSSIETEDSPVELNLQEIKTDPESVEDKSADTDVQLKEGFENIETKKELENSPPPAKQVRVVEENTDQPSSTEEDSTGFKNFNDIKQKIGNPPLDYPDFARRDGMEGTVSVLFFVTNQGLVDKIQLRSSSGYSELDNFVLRSLSRYEFLPDQEAWVQHDFSFRLEGQEEEVLKPRTLD